MENHKFWKTQPIDVTKNISENRTIEDNMMKNISTEPIKLPEGFEWATLDINNENDMNAVYYFLLNFYNENSNVSHRFHYSKDFLKWFLTPPSYYPDLLIGVKYNNKLLATIFGIPMTIKINDKVIKIVEINFLCIHHSLRNKRLTPVLIQEVTRRTNLHGIFQAFYTASIDLPNTILKTKYYHRLLNIPKLIDIKFIEKPTKVSYNTLINLFETIKSTNINIRKIENKDFESCCSLLNIFHEKFKISVLFNIQEFSYYFTFREKIIETYVVENNGIVTDMVSFYFIPTKLNKNNTSKHTDIYNAYIYYYFNTITDLVTLIDNGIYFLKKNNIDMVNAMKQYDNNKFLEKLKFKEGSGELNFYFYNWYCMPINEDDMAIVMV